MNDSTNSARRQRRRTVNFAEEAPDVGTLSSAEPAAELPPHDLPETVASPGQVLRFRAGSGEIHEVQLDCLAERFHDQLDWIEQLERPYVFELRRLSDYEEGDRWVVLQLVHLAGGECVQDLDTDEDPADLFSGVLAQLVSPEDVAQCKRAIDAALEAAVVAHPDALNEASARLASELKRLKIPGCTPAKLLKQAKELARGLVREDSDPVLGQFQVSLLSKSLPDAPVPAALLVPDGWEISAGGIAVEPLGDYDPPPVAHAPLVITKRFRDLDSQEVSVELAWRDASGWHTTVVSREQIADTRKLVALAGQGAPVHSQNAKELVRYLADFEAANDGRLPEDLQMRRLGWTEHASQTGFLLGNTWLQPPAAQEVPAETSQNNPPPVITFRAADDGDQQLVAGYQECGALDAWAAAVQQVIHYPLVRILVYASLAGPLLRLLKLPNFVVDLSGSTSTGKTTALRVAASIWGNPDETAVDSIVAGCNTTRVALERSLAIRTDLPNFVDDTKRALRTEDLSKLIYDAASGRGRQRGTVSGTAKMLI